MEEQKLKELIEKAINKGWVFFGEFSTDVATESVLKLLKEQLRLYFVSCSYIILYNNEEWDKFDGTLEQAIKYLKADSRYKDYGRNGATIFKGKDIYSIADKQTENIHI